MIDYSSICPGIRGIVRLLNENGLETSDSGDGSHYKAGMEGAMPVPMVVVVCPAERLLEVSRRVAGLLKAKGVVPDTVEACYQPGQEATATVLVTGEGLRDYQEPDDWIHPILAQCIICSRPTTSYDTVCLSCEKNDVYPEDIYGV